MIKALVLHGSPNRGGSSDTLAARFIQGLRSAAETVVAEVYANEVSVRPCQGCLRCNQPPEYTCFIKDDMQQIYKAFREADVVVWATPMYWGYITAQLKTILDRFEAIASPRIFGGKTFVPIITYHHHYESTDTFFRRICPFFNVSLHTLVYRSLDERSGGDVHVSRCSAKLDEAFELGKTVGAERITMSKSSEQLQPARD